MDNNVFIQTVTWNASLRNIDKGKTVKELKKNLESQNNSVILLVLARLLVGWPMGHGAQPRRLGLPFWVYDS